MAEFSFVRFCYARNRLAPKLSTNLAAQPHTHCSNLCVADKFNIH